MRPVSLIGVSFQDGTPHSYGMSVLRSAILHHQMASVATGNDVATLFFFTCYASFREEEFSLVVFFAYGFCLFFDAWPWQNNITCLRNIPSCRVIDCVAVLR